MKFILVSLACILIIMVGIILNKINARIRKPWNGYSVVTYEFANKRFNLAVADTAEKWEQGLMFVQKPQSIDGMVFIFPDKQVRTFWNKNTHLNLQLRWMIDDEIVGKSELPSIDISKKIVTVKSPEAVNKVIEIIE